MTEDTCDQELIVQRLSNVEQRVDGHEGRIASIEQHASQYAERIKSVDERVTLLVRDFGGQKEKLDQIEQKNSEENRRIIAKVEIGNDMLTDHITRVTDVDRRLKLVETNVNETSKDLKDYKTKNASLLEKMEHASRVLERVEHMVAALIGDLLKALRGLVIKGALIGVLVWLICHYFPELKPHIKEILAIGFPG